MPKTNCNIIKDLLPSYLDELCSTESKQLIEEHFEECKGCKTIYEQTKLIMLHNEHLQGTKEIDYFKTIRINVNKKNKTLLIITVILFLIQLLINLNPTSFGYSVLVSYANYIFPTLIAITLFAALPDFTEHSVSNKIKLPILGIEFIAMTYVFAIITYIGAQLLQGELPFGLKAVEIGPFLAIQLHILEICFILLFTITLIVSLRKKAICPALCFLPLGGLSLMFEYNHLLHEFTTRFTVITFIRPYLIIVCEILILTLGYMFMNRKKQL